MVGEKFVRFSFDELMCDLVYDVAHYPDFTCRPRDQEIKEILCQRLVLSNPRNRIIHSEARNPNYGFAVGEFLWYWHGSNSLEELEYYNKRAAQFSDDGKTVNSAYGYRLKFWKLSHDEDSSQWSTCIKTLVEDPDSRRAVLHINDPRDQHRAVTCGSKDVPCTLSLQFFIRENKLHLHVVMRSNDIFWGLTYDLFSFTLFQECMLLELRKHGMENLELGRYFHTAGSMHIYARHYDMATKMFVEYVKRFTDLPRGEAWLAPQMEPLESLEDLDKLMVLEEKLRLDKVIGGLPAPTGGAGLWMLSQLYEHRKKRDDEQVQ